MGQNLMTIRKSPDFWNTKKHFFAYLMSVESPELIPDIDILAS